jgi:beta-glucosidase
LTAASSADVIVAVLGEAAGWSGEAASRSDISISDTQKKLLAALLKTGKPVVLVLVNGRPLTLTWEDENVPAILETWAAGTEAGNAIAEALFGDYNPSGKLTMSFPRNTGQIPVYYSHKNTGRPFDEKNKFTSKYLDISNEPLYPFGYGLSYTTFEYGELTASKTNLKGDETLTVSITVRNTGKYAGEETVQLYIGDPVATISRPVKELKGFRKIFLQPGEAKEVTFTVTTEDLKFYNADLKYVREPGEFIIYAGPNSRDVKQVKVNWQ